MKLEIWSTFLWIKLHWPARTVATVIDAVRSCRLFTFSSICSFQWLSIPFVWHQPRRAADMSMNWWQSLFCCCTASMEQATDRAKLLWSTDSFRRDLKTFLFHSVYGHQDTDWLWCALGLLIGAQYKCLSYRYSILSDIYFYSLLITSTYPVISSCQHLRFSLLMDLLPYKSPYVFDIVVVHCTCDYFCLYTETISNSGSGGGRSSSS